MYNDSTKPTWNVTFWALAGFAVVIAIVFLVGSENSEIAARVVAPNS